MKKQFPLYFDEKSYNQLKEEARKRDVSMNALIKIKLNLDIGEETK